VRALALACGNVEHLTAAPWFTERLGAGDVLAVAARPGKDEVRPALEELAGVDARLVVAGRDSDLAAVVLRLLRGELLGRITVGFVPAGPSEAAANWGLPAEPREALGVALDGQARGRSLVRDDNGGVLVGLGVLAPVVGLAYCDDTRVLDGRARRMEVRPCTEGVQVRVAHPGLLRKRVETTRGRALQIGCEPSSPTSDGVTFPRALERWTWYRHTEQLRVAAG
jgi:hypothetical protein